VPTLERSLWRENLVSEFCVRMQLVPLHLGGGLGGGLGGVGGINKFGTGMFKVGLYKLHSSLPIHSLEAPGFNP
jgi:hypothetical protein